MCEILNPRLTALSLEFNYAALRIDVVGPTVVFINVAIAVMHIEVQDNRHFPIRVSLKTIQAKNGRLQIAWPL